MRKPNRPIFSHLPPPAAGQILGVSHHSTARQHNGARGQRPARFPRDIVHEPFCLVV